MLGQGVFGTVMAVKDKQTQKSWAAKIVDKTQAVSASIWRILTNVNTVAYWAGNLKHSRIKCPTGKSSTAKFRSWKSSTIPISSIWIGYTRLAGRFIWFWKNATQNWRPFWKKRRFSPKQKRGKWSRTWQAPLLTYTNTVRTNVNLATLCTKACCIVTIFFLEIVHRDLKLENIMTATNPDDITDPLFIKVTDFGLGIIKTGSKPGDLLKERCGTLTYMGIVIIMTFTHEPFKIFLNVKLLAGHFKVKIFVIRQGGGG